MRSRRSSIICQKHSHDILSTLTDSNKVGDPENLYQISLLIDHLKHDEVHFREQAARSLALIGETHRAILIHITNEKKSNLFKPSSPKLIRATQLIK